MFLGSRRTAMASASLLRFGSAAALVLLLAADMASAAADKSKGTGEADKLERRQDYGDYGDYTAALLEEGGDEGDDAVLYAAFAYDVDDDGGEAVYDYGDPDYEGSEKKEKTAESAKPQEKKPAPTAKAAAS